MPAPLIAVVGGIALVALASIDEHGVALIAPVPSGLPTPVTPDVDHLGALLPGAFAIAIMCFLETAAVARSVRRPDEPSIDNDQELAANGVACIAGAFFRAMPAAGGFSQTAINQRAGARTQLSEIVTALLAVLCALFLGGVLSDLPQATLGCLVMIAVLGLIKPAEFVRYWRLSRIEFWVAAITAVVGLAFGLLVAVLAGVILTLFLVLYELDRMRPTELQATLDGAMCSCRVSTRRRSPACSSCGSRDRCTRPTCAAPTGGCSRPSTSGTPWTRSCSTPPPSPRSRSRSSTSSPSWSGSWPPVT